MDTFLNIKSISEESNTNESEKQRTDRKKSVDVYKRQLLFTFAVRLTVVDGPSMQNTDVYKRQGSTALQTSRP